MQFSNPVVGGTTLIRDAIQSDNYTAGNTGWSVMRNGTAEFNNIIIRNGETVSSTDLYYNGTPGTGTIIASISPTSGIDPYGNVYLAGITTYDYSTGTFVNLDNGSIYVGQIGINPTGPKVPNAAQFYNSGGSTVILGSTPPSQSAEHAPQITLQPGSAGSSVVTINDASNVYNTILRVSGPTVKAQVNGTPWTWQSPTLASGWGAGPASGTVQQIQFRYDTEDNVWIEGTAHTTNTTPTSGIFTLPSGYAPLIEHRRGIMAYVNGTPTMFGVQIEATGLVNIFPTPSIANQDFYFDIRVPLGNIA